MYQQYIQMFTTVSNTGHMGLNRNINIEQIFTLKAYFIVLLSLSVVSWFLSWALHGCDVQICAMQS